MKKLIFTFLTMFIFVLTYGQTEEKIYYDENWHGCTKANEEYYRIVSFDENNRPIGQVKDYFISGELQGSADGAIKIDKNNDENSIFTGKIVGYYKNGNKRFENFYSESGKPLKFIVKDVGYMNKQTRSRKAINRQAVLVAPIL